MAVSRILAAWALVAQTTHMVELSGDFSADLASSRFLAPLGGEVLSLRLDGAPVTLTRSMIDSGFVETEEFGRSFLMVSDRSPGYRAILRDDQIAQLEGARP